jgi:WD40 repeat protein
MIGTPASHQLVTASTDGRVCVWAADALHQPLEVLELHTKHSKVCDADYFIILELFASPPPLLF